MLIDIDTLPNGIFLENLKGEFVTCNSKYLEILDMDGKDRQRVNWRLLLSEEDKTEAIANWEKAVRVGKATHVDCKLLKGNGNEIWVEIKGTPSRDVQGQLTGYTGIISDITNRVMFEKVLERFKKAVEKTDSQVYFTDPQGIILYANDSIKKITGFSPEEVIGIKAGKRWGNLMDREFYQKMWDTISLEKSPFTAEIINKRKNGEIYYADVNITPILDSNGQVEFFVGIERDITYIKEMDKVKNEFLTLASHQLRTPLSSIKWLCEIFWQENNGVMTDGQKDILTKVQNENERLIRLVNSLLSFSRIESKKMNMTPSNTNIRNLISGVVETHKRQMDEKKQTLEVKLPDKDVELFVDPKLVAEAVSNLVSNAIKYSGREGRLWLKGDVVGKDFVLKITDNGIGIPTIDQRRIFDRFFRAQNANTALTDGNGLGLYFVKWVAEQHAGRVWFESTENVGTSFYLSLPLPQNS